jgi:cohesin complex subunit SA-1/2
MFEETFEARKMRLDAVTQSPSKGRAPKQKSRTAEVETQIAFKCLAHLLLKLERESKSGTSEGDDGESSHSEDEEVGHDDPEMAGQYYGSLYQNDSEKGRIDFAVEDLWPRVEVLHDWQALCQYLLLDHTASTNRTQTSSIPAQPGRSSVSLPNTDIEGSADEEAHQDSVEDLTTIDDACKLSEAEENILVEVLVASLRKFGSTLTTAEALKSKKRKMKKRQQPEATDEEGATTEDEATVARRLQELTEDEPENKTDLTRVMINLLPKLWSKFVTDPVKLAEVFRIPKLMCLNMYLDLRMVSVSAVIEAIVCNTGETVGLLFLSMAGI